jgi:ABC-2 type transport system ATP-binding protein
VRLAQSLDGQEPELNGIVSIEEWGERWFRYRADEPEATNPLVLRRLSSLGLDVVTLSEVPQSLEEVYLHVVNNTRKDAQP